MRFALHTYAGTVHRAFRVACNRTVVRAALGSVRGLEFDRTVRFAGWPIVDIADGGRVVLEPGVVLNSDNDGYHLNMHSPVKLMADRRGAEIRVGRNTRLHGTCVHAYARVEIGARCLVAANTQIMDGDGHDLSLDNPRARQETKGRVRPVVIGDDVWIGEGALILPGARLGDGAVVAARSVVTGEVPAGTLVGGNPARELRRRSGLEEQHVQQ